MILTVDNLDGRGAQDYTAVIDRTRASEPLIITRKLNAPATLKTVLCLAASSLIVPVRRARVIASTDAGTTLFTGYLTLEPAAVYAGESAVGPVYGCTCTPPVMTGCWTQAPGNSPRPAVLASRVQYCYKC